VAATGKNVPNTIVAIRAAGRLRLVEIVILMPVYNDWTSVEEVIVRLDRAFASSDDSIAILLVDDGSTAAPPLSFAGGPYAKLDEVSVLRLKKNLGHQRALATGLCYISEKRKSDALLVMDGDGEDNPDDAVRLLERMKQISPPSMVFAERTRRSESLDFRVAYLVYRILHYLLTGLSIRVGNFSAIPVSFLPALAVEPMLWNHYAACAVRLRLPMATVPTDRGKRISGRSRHRFAELVVHGLSALACYNEIIGVRVILVSSVLFLLAFLGAAALVGLKLFTTLPIPGWTSLLLALIAILIVQIVIMATNFTMQIIDARTTQPFLPARDHAWFISSFKTLYKKAM
jgi:glycosyltransferase involved in cell wall biosynthesis